MRAPEWEGLEWLQGGPLDLGSLGAQHKAVLLRFWLTECPYCRRSAPALRELDRRYRDRGLLVVGLHHPKSERARDPAFVRQAAAELGFEFPLALDNEWKTVGA